MKSELAVMIPTTKGRRKCFMWGVKNLLKHVRIPFSLFVYNDLGSPLTPAVNALRTRLKREDVSIVVLNDKQEISRVKVGCGGARHLLFNTVKDDFEVVASLDDDMQITPGWYETVKKAIDSHPEYSVFTSTVRNKSIDGPLRAIGAMITFEGNGLRRRPVGKHDSEYLIADWGPLGCLVFCRKALAPEVEVPPLFFGEDTAMFLVLHSLGINKTVVATKATAVHKPIDAPQVQGFRTKDHIQTAIDYVWERFEIDLSPNYGLSPKHAD